MDISIVIVGWNAKHYLELCLESLAVAPPRRSMEVIVVDNASADGSAEMIETRFCQCEAHQEQRESLFFRGQQLGDPPVPGPLYRVGEPGCADYCIPGLSGCFNANFLDQNRKVGNVGPRVLNPDKTLQSTCRRSPTLWNNFCSATGLAVKFKKSRLFAGEHMLYFPHDRTLPVDVIVGCFSMIRREAFNDVGLLDENLFMYGDDVDWCRRCWNAGWQVVFFPGAEAIHDRGKITAPYPVRFAVAQQTSILYYWRKHHGFWGETGIRSILFFRHLARYATSVVVGFARRNGTAEVDVRKQVSGACLRELFSGTSRPKLERQPAS